MLLRRQDRAMPVYLQGDGRIQLILSVYQGPVKNAEDADSRLNCLKQRGPATIH